jgi:DNA-binding CsgD family transcriptional regulator
MNANTKKAIAIGAAALVVAGGAAGGASGAMKSPTRAATAQHRFVRHGVFRAVSDYVGLTPRQLFRQLRSGKSLAEIATAQGKTVEGLKSAILSAVKARLDLVVTANRITSAQEQTFLDRVQARLDTLVNRHFGHPTP